MPPIDNSKRALKDEFESEGYPNIERHQEELLVIVKAAPQPSLSHRETVCVACITKAGKWIRLYPISFRYMNFLRRFQKYQWISAEIEKSKKEKDFRKDSYRPIMETIRPLGKPLGTKRGWEERKNIILPTASVSLEEIKESYKSEKVSLGMFKPKRMVDFIVEEDEKEWSNKHRQLLCQRVLFGTQPKELEKVPFKFSYIFECDRSGCKTHKIQIVDWEIYALYRNIKNNYPYSLDKVLQKIKDLWLGKMWDQKRNSYLIVGSRFPYPSFVVLGVFWPPK